MSFKYNKYRYEISALEIENDRLRRELAKYKPPEHEVVKRDLYPVVLVEQYVTVWRSKQGIRYKVRLRRTWERVGYKNRYGWVLIAKLVVYSLPLKIKEDD